MSTDRPEPSSTREKLIEAATAEFLEYGYLETNTNRIARRGGFSPQTFYRHFDTKLDVFKEVYSRWITESWRLIGAVLESGSDIPRQAEEIASTIEAHYRDSRMIRASLRMLAVDDDGFRELYLAEGRRQLEITRANRLRRGQDTRPAEEYLAMLLIVERLADALAFDEVEALGVPPTALRSLLARVLVRYLSHEALVPEIAAASVDERTADQPRTRPRSSARSNPRR